MIYYRLLVYKPDDCRPDMVDDCPDVLDFQCKENAVSVARSLMEMGLNKSEEISLIDVYEMHDDENRSYTVLSISF